MNIRPLASSEVFKAVPLMAELGYPTDPASLGKRFAAVTANLDDAVLIAEEQGTIVGLVALHSFEMLHRPGRLGRVTALVVAHHARGHGIGGQLLNAAEKHLRGLGCIRLEVTSAEERTDAHRFYRAHGYEERRVRFLKSVAPPE